MPPKATGKDTKRSAKGSKKGQKWLPKSVTITTYCDDDDDKEADGSDEEHVTTAERDLKPQAWQSTDHFEKLLEATYPNHAYPIKHKLKECSMMKNYMTTGALAVGKKLEGDPGGKAATPFPGEEVAMSICGGPDPHESWCKLKLTSWAVHAMSSATPEYLRWSKSPITFDRTDHLDCITKLGRFPLIIDALVRMTPLTKALMDGGSDLNIMYLNTFEGLGLPQDQLKNSSHPLYGVVPGKQSIPLEQITLYVTFRDASNYWPEMVIFEVVDFFGPYHVIMGWPCYVKFMAIPSYAYLKLKILGHANVITMEARAQWALDCE
jgi:hypothetical protein